MLPQTNPVVHWEILASDPKELQWFYGYLASSPRIHTTGKP